MKRKLVLIVDKNRDFTDGYSRIIERLGHFAHVIEKIEKLQMFYEHINPDVILLNQSMIISKTRINILLSGLKKTNPDTKVVFISNYPPDPKIVPFLERKEAAYLGKPPDLEQIKQLLR